MSIPFRARIVDLSNLVVAKGANFLLTVLLFAIVSRDMNAHAFAEFGYWWSVAIMIGGVLLGGFSSALVRAAAVHGSLRYLTGPLRRGGLALAALAGVTAIVLSAASLDTRIALLVAAIAGFGLAVQFQASLLALLRAAEATRANVIASALILLFVPLATYLALGSQRDLPRVFIALTGASAIGTSIALASAGRSIRHLWAPATRAAPAIGRFLASASAFTAVNVFSYVIVTVDFTLFRFIGAPDDFARMGTAKVFFERFVVPALMVFAGAVSLAVLRHPHEPGVGDTRLEIRLDLRILAGTVVLLTALTLAYRIFAHDVRGDATTIALPWVGCAALGYLLFAVNGILFDVLVVRRSLSVVALHVTAFLAFGAALQALAITTGGVPGWAVAWLAFNLVVAAILSREGLRVKLGQFSAIHP